LNHRLAEVTTGKFLGPDVERMGVAELAEDFLRDYRINAKSSFDDAEARWRLHIQPFFGSSYMQRRSQASLLNRYVDNRQEAGAKNATINRELAALKRMFQSRAQGDSPQGCLLSQRFRGSPKTTFVKASWRMVPIRKALWSPAWRFGFRRSLRWAPPMDGALANF
jgi:hypothetical protein